MQFEGLVNSIRSEAAQKLERAGYKFEGLVNSIRSEAMHKMLLSMLSLRVLLIL